MSDRHRAVGRGRVNGLTAAARILNPTREDAPRAQSWHEEAWTYRDTVGELHFAEMWLSNAFSRSRLFPARRTEPGREPEPIEDGPAVDLVARLAGGIGGQAALLRDFGPFLLVPGVGYLVGEPAGNAETFTVVDTEDIRLSHRAEGYELRTGDGTMSWRPLPPGSVVTKVFRRHPRHRWEADSPTRAALPILRELVLLTQHVEASATSRLAGAGVQAFPSEIEFEEGWDSFVRDYVEAMTKPAKDRSLAAALVPFPIRMPGDRIEQFRSGYISYSTAFDEKSIELREEAITRLGNAMDMPRQVLTAEQRNHWGDWQVEESGLKLHVEPGLETVCEGLTVGFLLPGLDAIANQSRVAQREIESLEGDVLIWYDTSDLRVRPDRSSAAEMAYDRWELDGDTLRRELGLSEAEGADPDDPETQRRIWMKLLDHPQLAPLALEKLGLVEAEDISVATAGGRTTVVPAGVEHVQPAGQGRGGQGLPDTRENESRLEPGGGRGERPAPSPPAAPGAPAAPRTPAPPSVAEVEVPDVPPEVTPGVAIVAALDGIVHRALERAGSRALNKLPRADRNVPAVRLHTYVDITRVLPPATLLADAWERVPEVAERLDLDVEPLVATCDAYVRGLFEERRPHSWEGLAEALGVCPCEQWA